MNLRVRLRVMSAFCTTILLVFLCAVRRVSGEAVQLTQDNVQHYLDTNNVLFVNFYADWCRFSQMLAPIWTELADKVHGDRELSFGDTTVKIAKVDCEHASSVCERFRVSKYPTIKLFWNGEPAKKEYRDQRSVESFWNFLKKETADPVREVTSLDGLKNRESKGTIIAYLDKKEGPVMELFRKLAKGLFQDCAFVLAVGDFIKHLKPPEEEGILVFREANSVEDQVVENALQDDYDQLQSRLQEMCMPLVREITFENAEELTEEGIPFLILFHMPDDTESPRVYKRVVESSLLSQKGSVNFLVADGVKFSHPLRHLGKAKDDLPLIAIDSFRHMYLFEHPFKTVEEPGKLLQFVQDLHSGKLHREFHYGPDPTAASSDADTQGSDASGGAREQKEQGPTVKKSTSPPESVFKDLGPSDMRYTLLNKDEL